MCKAIFLRVYSAFFLKAFLLIGLFFSNSAFSQNQDGKLNVLFIMADDMNERCSVLGYHQVVTPNLERLAKRGMVFTNAYTQFSLCNPSRASILTGWRPDATKVFDNVTSPRSKIGSSVRFIPEYFHDFGYSTERYGKVMHSEFENQCSWDYIAPITGIQVNNFISGAKPAQWWVTNVNDSLISQALLCTRLASSLLVKKTKPFFYALGLETTHTPFTPGIVSWNKYGDHINKELMKIDSSGRKTTLMGNGSGNIQLPDTPPNDLSDIPGLEISPGVMLTLPDEEWKKSIHAYYAEVTEMDTQLGKVLDALDEKNLWANTVIVFISDHGQFLGEHEGMWLKNSLLNEALHVPMIICAPGLPAGRCDKLVELVDLYPTLADLCEVKRPAGLQGTSLVPLLVNPKLEWKPAVFSQIRRGTSFNLRSLYTDKYHYSRLGASYELYDRTKDPLEYINLALDSAYTDTLKKLNIILDSGWRKSLPPTKDSFVYFIDKDNDGYGSVNKYIFSDSIVPDGYAKNAFDCNDNDSAIYPGANETCDNIDNNCDGIISSGSYISPSTPVSFCLGASATLTALGDSTKKYQWLRNGVPINDAVIKTHVVSVAGSYAVCQYNSEGCGDTSVAVTVTVINPPPSAVTVSANTNVCIGQVVITAPVGQELTYQWIKDDLNIAVNGKAQIYYPKSAGNFKVKVTNSFKCTATSRLIKVTNICTSALIDQQGISAVFPNPANDKVYINYKSANSSKVTVSIKSSTGAVIQKVYFNVAEGDNTLILNVSNFMTGNYFVEAFDKASVSNSKIIIIR